MPEEVTYVNERVAVLYRNPVWGHTEQRCEHPMEPGARCGLPAWDGATGHEACCEFHSPNTPRDIAHRLRRAVALRANLSGARLSGAPLCAPELFLGEGLSDAVLPDADLSGAHLRGAVACSANLRFAQLSGAQLAGAHLPGADLTGATFGDLHTNSADGRRQTTQPPDLRMADLRGADMSGANIAPSVLLDGIKLGRTKDGPVEDRVLGDYPDVYRQLKMAFQYAGDYERAGSFFYWEMRSRRHCANRAAGRAAEGLGPALAGLGRVARKSRLGRRWHYPLRAWWRMGGTWRRNLTAWARAWPASLLRRDAWGLRGRWLFEKLCGYGELPWNVLRWAVGVVVVWAVLQAGNGVHDDKVMTHGFWTGLYYSVVTFTTLGYGDIAPEPGSGRFLAGFEALVGAFLMALFLVCVVRKFSR
jgi:hypothetical protein